MPEKKVLIIDPDVASRNFIARHFLKQNYEIVEAGSGKEGLIYAWRDRPDLAVADPVLPDLPGEELARKLKQDPRSASMPLIALSSDPSAARVRSCLEAGFGDYIAKSGQAMPLLMESASRLLGVSVMGVKKGGLLMIFQSAKGGTGASSICANIAMNLAQNQPEARTAVVDLVLPIGSIASIVGYNGLQNIVTVSDMPPAEATPAFFRDTLPQMGVWRFSLLAGSPDPESSVHLKAAHIMEIISALKDAYDYVVIDIGRSLSRITLPLVQIADVNVLVVSTDMSAIALTKTVVEYLKGKGVNPASIYAILNRAIGLEGLSRADAEQTLDIPIRATLPYLGGNMALANSQCQPYSLKFPKDTASIVLQEAAKEMSDLARQLRARPA
ncbi:MAG: response regulator [Chloroflexi bacterium]|nr:response regulator [Chloroflexota bacterium]